MGILRRVLFASGPVMRVLMGAGAIALLVAGVKNSGRNKDKAGIQNKESAQTPNKT